MNFFDTVAGMGYIIKKEENNNIIHLIKGNSLVEIHILFLKEEKKITGFLKPKDLFYTVDDMSIMYRTFLEMKKDLNFFIDKSHYDIL